MKAQVLLPKIFNFSFTYKFNSECKIGDLVEVPFGSKNENWSNLEDKYSEQNIKIKDIKKNTGYSINSKLVDFIEWFFIIQHGSSWVSFENGNERNR